MAIVQTIQLELRFVEIASSADFGESIEPLGGKEIIVIGPEVEGTCLFCLEFERKVTSKYNRHNIP